MRGPLEGVSIVDFGRAASAPYAARVLADLGADVVKIEPVEGNFDRKIGGPHRGGVDAFFLATNNGKRSIAVDLRSDEGRAAAKDIMVSADAVLANFRPGVLAKMGLSYEDLSAVDERVILVEVNGFGSTGPYRDAPAYDTVVQGLSGMIGIQRRAGTGPPDLIHNTVADKVTALFAANAVQAAIIARARHGKGQHVEIPMLDASIYFLWPDGMADQTFVGEHIKGFMGARTLEPTQLADGEAVYMAISFKQRLELLRAVGRDDLTTDPRFATTQALSEPGRLVEFYRIVAEAARAMSKEGFVAELQRRGIPAGPILAPHEVVENEHVREVGILHEWTDDAAGTVRTPVPPARFGRDQVAPRYEMRPLGADGRDLLTEVGWTAERVDKMAANGEILLPDDDA